MQSKRNLKLSIAVISEGDTEGWYLRQLRSTERVNIDIFPKEGRNLHSLEGKIDTLVSENVHDYIFCLVDMDTKVIEPERTRFNNLTKKYSRNVKVSILRSQPCFEYWFYLHRERFSDKIFLTWENEEPLKPEIRKIIPGYEKKRRFYYTNYGKCLYKKLRSKLIYAARNSMKLKTNHKYHYCQMFSLIGLILCEKIKSDSARDFFICFNKKKLCTNLENYLSAYQN